jgi:uncharacterized repeat protein (TIGR03803 family)
LVQGSDGSFYGTTHWGGNGFTGIYTGKGTVFRITTNGVLDTLVYFDITNGGVPNASLTLGRDGYFYGTTVRGGTFDLGTVFKLGTDGAIATLISFDGIQGTHPFGPVTQGLDGCLYGTTASQGSIWTNGTIFKVTTNGVLTTLAYLDVHPAAVVTLASDGNLYGAATDSQLSYSLDGSAGSVFRLVQQPQITSLARTSNQVTFDWSSFTNGIYEVQSKASVAGTGWTTIGTGITATGASTSFTTPSLEAPQSYYRVVLLP